MFELAALWRKCFGTEFCSESQLIQTYLETEAKEVPQRHSKRKEGLGIMKAPLGYFSAWAEYLSFHAPFLSPVPAPISDPNYSLSSPLSINDQRLILLFALL